MNSSAYKYSVLIAQMTAGLVIGVVIACSPTKFSPTNTINNECVSTSTSSCVTTNGYQEYSEIFKVGAGKVDILFINDNSASMSFEQKNMAARFGGFIEQLKNKEIDYKIAMVTTDLPATHQKKFVTFDHGSSFLTTANHANAVGLFNAAIARPETVQCETYMRNAINNYGPGWRSDSRYAAGYSQNCPSPDERGLYTSSIVLSENTEGFLRADAHLNVIVISDEDVRSGSKHLYEAQDRYENFIAMMNQTHSTKYWDFNSIIVRDNNCAAVQSQQIVDQQGQSAVGSSIGDEYAKVSYSAAKDLNGNPRPRGFALDICQNDYAQHFSTIATQISDSSRLKTLKCKPVEAPVVQRVSNPNQTVPYTWDGNQSIVFQAGSEGIPATIKYRCYTGPK